VILDQRDPRILLGFELAVGAPESIAARCHVEGIDAQLKPRSNSLTWWTGPSWPGGLTSSAKRPRP
jgi:hypothetical protein